MPHAASDEKNGPSTDSSYRSSNPSAPLLPSSPYDPAIPDMEPPSYSSVVAQDSNDWKNRSSSFSPHINGGKSTSDLDNQAPYPLGPGPTSQLPYPTGDCSTEEVVVIPMPMPMPASIKIERPIGFTEAITSEPKSANLGLTVGGHGSTMTDAAPDSLNGSSESIGPTTWAKVRSTMKDTGANPMNSSSEFINSTMSGEYSKFSPRRQRQLDQRAQRRPKTPAADETSFLECCLCCCECCFEVSVAVITSDDD